MQGSQEQERFREFDDFLQHAAASTSSAQRLTPYVSPAQVGPLCEVKSVDEDAYYRCAMQHILALPVAAAAHGLQCCGRRFNTSAGAAALVLTPILSTGRTDDSS